MITTSILGVSLIASTILPGNVDASAATKKVKKVTTGVKVSKSGKLISLKTGRIVKGTVSYKGKVYKNGKKASGIINRTFFKNGKKATGVYKSIYYKNGVIGTGTYKGVLYLKGKKANGLVKGIYYKAGKKATGVYKNTYYQNGKKGTGIYKGKYYELGKALTDEKLNSKLLSVKNEVTSAEAALKEAKQQKEDLESIENKLGTTVNLFSIQKQSVKSNIKDFIAKYKNKELYTDEEKAAIKSEIAAHKATVQANIQASAQKLVNLTTSLAKTSKIIAQVSKDKDIVFAAQSVVAHVKEIITAIRNVPNLSISTSNLELAISNAEFALNANPKKTTQPVEQNPTTDTPTNNKSSNNGSNNTSNNSTTDSSTGSTATDNTQTKNPKTDNNSSETELDKAKTEANNAVNALKGKTIDELMANPNHEGSLFEKAVAAYEKVKSLDYMVPELAVWGETIHLADTMVQVNSAVNSLKDKDAATLSKKDSYGHSIIDNAEAAVSRLLDLDANADVAYAKQEIAKAKKIVANKAVEDASSKLPTSITVDKDSITTDLIESQLPNLEDKTLSYEIVLDKTAPSCTVVVKSSIVGSVPSTSKQITITQGITNPTKELPKEEVKKTEETNVTAVQESGETSNTPPASSVSKSLSVDKTTTDNSEVHLTGIVDQTVKRLVIETKSNCYEASSGTCSHKSSVTPVNGEVDQIISLTEGKGDYEVSVYPIFNDDVYYLEDLLYKENIKNTDVAAPLRIEGTTSNSEVSITGRIPSNVKSLIVDVIYESGTSDQASLIDIKDVIKSDGTISAKAYLREGAGNYTVKLYYNTSDDKTISYPYLMEGQAVNSDTRTAYELPSSNVQSDNKEIVSLAKDITKDADDDLAKVKAIHDWVAKNISYDTEDFFKDLGKSQDAYSTYKNKTAICQGYADLTAALLRAVGIKAKVIGGVALGYGMPNSWDELKTTASNHAWNEALVDGNWIILDTTWDSGYIDSTSQKFVWNNKDNYFNPKAEDFAKDHLKNEELIDF